MRNCWRSKSALERDMVNAFVNRKVNRYDCKCAVVVRIVFYCFGCDFFSVVKIFVIDWLWRDILMGLMTFKKLLLAHSPFEQNTD